MSVWLEILVVAALLGAALMAGLFFVFSVCIMRAFSEIAPWEGIHAMRSINRVILNPWFLIAFIGSTLLSVIIAVVMLLGGVGPDGYWVLIAAVLFVFGTFLITGIGNVPLNHQLDEVAECEAETFWKVYLRKWTHLNHGRTAASSLSVVFYAIGLIQL